MILMNDFHAEPEELIQAQLRASERVLRSGWYILGKEGEAFEKEWAMRCSSAFAVGVGNGMDAIEIGLRSLEIGSGDEVITTPMTAFATVLAILRSGATPVFADIDPNTALLDIDRVARCITPKTKAILLVHLYGQIRQMEAWVELCQSNHLVLLEDCAQSHLAQWNGKVAGTFGQWGAYSFYPTKNLGTMGDGGALITNEQEIANQAKQLRNYGQTTRYHHPIEGLNSRLDELHAAILRVRLSWLSQCTQKRQQIAQRYFKEISNSKIELLSPPLSQENHVYHLFVVLSEERENLMLHLKENNIASLIHYPIPVHQQKPCIDMIRDPQGLTKTEEHARKCVSSPCHPYMSANDISTVIETINVF